MPISDGFNCLIEASWIILYFIFRDGGRRVEGVAAKIVSGTMQRLLKTQKTGKTGLTGLGTSVWRRETGLADLGKYFLIPP